MIPYWILFVVWAAGAVQYNRAHTHVRNSLYLNLAVIATALMIGLRYQVGGDWGNYQRIFDDLSILDFREAMGSGDPAYTAISWVANWLGLGIVTVNMICGAIFMWGLSSLAHRQPNPWLSVLVAVPYFIIVVAMGYTRQATAIGIVMAALAVANERNIVRPIIYLFIAAAFHKSAVLAFPVIGAAVLRRSPIAAVGGAVAFMGAYFVFLSSSVDRLVTNYVEQDYDSQGAMVRVAMDALAATAFLLFRKSMKFDDFERAMWTTFAWLSLASLVALAFVSSTTAIDRVALFLIPLQVVTFGRLPYLTAAQRPANGQMLFAVVAYSFAVQFIWLTFADNAGYWLPYNAAPFATPDQ